MSRMRLISNKRITRLQSDVDLNNRLVNRNPQNLEMLAFQKKPTGYWLDKKDVNYYNRLEFHQSGKHLIASLVHWSGKPVISASTKEPALTKYYNSPGATEAAKILAQVISRRCLEAGYLVAVPDIRKDSPKSKIFYDVVEQSGLTLQEPPEIVPRTTADL